MVRANGSADGGKNRRIDAEVAKKGLVGVFEVIFVVGRPKQVDVGFRHPIGTNAVR